MARIPGVPTKQAGLLTKLVYWYSRRRYGAVPEPVTVTAHHPKLLINSGRFEMRNEKAMRVLPASLRDLVVYRAATQVGCSWCVDFGTMLQRLKGLDVDRLTDVDNYATSPRFTPIEKLALAYTDAMTGQPMRVTDEQVAELDTELGHAGLVELTFAIALENMRGRFNHALGITDQGFTSGAACKVLVPSDAALNAGHA